MGGKPRAKAPQQVQVKYRRGIASYCMHCASMEAAEALAERLRGQGLEGVEVVGADSGDGAQVEEDEA